MLQLAGLAPRRDPALAGNARAFLIPGAFVLAADQDPDGDPWVLAHGIWHRQFDLVDGSYVCVEAVTVAEAAADVFAGYLLIGEVPSRHGHDDQDLAAALGVSVERIQAWQAQLALPHRASTPLALPESSGRADDLAEEAERSDGHAR